MPTAPRHAPGRAAASATGTRTRCAALLEVAAQQLRLLGPLRLAPQSTPARDQFLKDVAHPLQVTLGLLNAAQGLLALAQMRRDPRSLFEKGATRVGPQGQGRVDHALADDGVPATGQPGTAEDIQHVAVAHLGAVEEVLVLSGAVSAAPDHHLRELQGQDPLRVVDGDQYLGQAHARPPARAGKDHVFGRLGSQRVVALLAHDPADGVRDVALAAAVGADHGGNAVTELEHGACGKALEAVQLQAFQAHGFSAGALHGYSEYTILRRRVRARHEGAGATPSGGQGSGSGGMAGRLTGWLPRAGRDETPRRPWRRPVRPPAWCCPLPGPRLSHRRGPGP